jgi:hypothetical protein
VSGWMLKCHACNRADAVHVSGVTRGLRVVLGGLMSKLLLGCRSVSIASEVGGRPSCKPERGQCRNLAPFGTSTYRPGLGFLVARDRAR